MELCGKRKYKPTANIWNTKQEISIKGTCQIKNTIYGAIFTRCSMICMGQMGVKLSRRFSNHLYDIKNCPDDPDIIKHFHTRHQGINMKAFFLDTGLSKLEEDPKYR